MTGPWVVFGLGCILVLLHLTFYLVLLRDWPALKNEKAIFLSHCGSFAALVFAAAASCILVPGEQMVKAALAALALHAIYSMSFLELWSLSQSSYSIAMLDAIEEQPDLNTEALTARFAATGKQKKEARLLGLERMGLLRRGRGRLELARRGWVAAALLLALRFIAKLGHTG